VNYSIKVLKSETLRIKYFHKPQKEQSGHINEVQFKEEGMETQLHQGRNQREDSLIKGTHHVKKSKGSPLKHIIKLFKFMTQEMHNISQVNKI